MHILLLDNNDSFTYNLSQQLERLGAEVEVLNIEKLSAQAESTVELTLPPYDALVISPGPKAPKDYPFYARLLAKESTARNPRPILGVCLGHQILGEFFGAKTIRAQQVMHGKTSLIHHTGKGLFADVPNPMKVARYHSLMIDAVPSSSEPLAQTKEGVLMAFRHQTLPFYGVQFHPESFLTEGGDQLIHNFLKTIREV